MQIGSKSNTYLKQIQSRAKMHEYHVAEKDYVQIEEKAQWIIILGVCRSIYPRSIIVRWTSTARKMW